MAINPLNKPSILVLGSLMGVGNPLGCLFALILMGPFPVSTLLVSLATKQDERVAKRGLKTLELMGLSINVPRGPADGWMLTPQTYQLPFVIDLIATMRTTADYEALPAQNAVSVMSLPAQNAGKHAQPAQNAVSSPQSQSQLITINTDSDSENWPKSKTDLEAAYLEVLAAGPVYLSIRRPLAEKLSERPDFLRHLLAHVARAKAGRTDGYAKPGVYVRDHAEAMARVADDELPPASLTFSEAMRWAIHGGKTDAQLAAEKEQAEQAQRQAEQDARQHEAEQLELVALSAAEEADRARRQARVAQQAARVDPALDAPLNAQTHLTPRLAWEAALGQLALEMPRATFDTWLKGAHLLAYAEHTFVIGVRDKHKKDWLENRLSGTVRRVLSGLIGHPIAARFDLDLDFIS